MAPVQRNQLILPVTLLVEAKIIAESTMHAITRFYISMSKIARLLVSYTLQ